jgi:hypothetical protein
MAVIEAIETVYLEADAASVTFSSIPATYEHLQLRINARTTTSSNFENTQVIFNGVTTSTYHRHTMYALGTTLAIFNLTSQPSITGPLNAGSGLDAAYYGMIVMDILDYRNANKNTTILFNSSASAASYSQWGSGMWDDTAAVTSITLTTATYVRGSEFTLYGLTDS